MAHVVCCFLLSLVPRLAMANKCQELAKLIMDLINKIARSKANKVREEFVRIAGRCQKKPTTVEVLYQNKDFIAQVPETVSQLVVQIEVWTREQSRVPSSVSTARVIISHR
eukprot:NODE_9522_length_514_cov_22.470284_g9499_i0.p2 GENE.NODE_9522_length_514_cov_22.470284_g9499_i0~~NODE_9522_length_514_cov_22.470284_g9499_i0.p2  ORF type:complete len:122 (-),score=31.63 NODE_9522_length_514_cov_22.470284_g9499_i0:147-479(-)